MTLEQFIDALVDRRMTLVNPGAGRKQGLDDLNVNIRSATVGGRPKRLLQYCPSVHVHHFKRSFFLQKHLHYVKVPAHRGIVQARLSGASPRA